MKNTKKTLTKTEIAKMHEAAQADDSCTALPIKTKKTMSRLQELKKKMVAWMENKGPRPSDDEIRELCKLRKEAETSK